MGWTDLWCGATEGGSERPGGTGGGGEDQFVQVEEVDQRAEEGHEKDYIFDDGAIPEFGHWFLIEDYTFALGKSEGVDYNVWAL